MNSSECSYTISTDPGLLSVDVIHCFLTKSYWAEHISREIVERAIGNSFCFGVYQGQGLRINQVGFARVIADYSTFDYICDVFILEGHRGKDLSKRLINEIMTHPRLQGFRRWTLATRDAHALYEKFGFTSLEKPGRSMEIHRPGIYKKDGKGIFLKE